MSRTALMLSWTVCSKSSKLRFHDIPLYWKYTVSQKNAPTLASSSFDKHGLISIIFGKQRQHTFKNDMPMRVQLSLSLHVYLLYLLLNSCDGNIDLTQWTEMTRSDVTRYSWNNPAPSAGNKGAGSYLAGMAVAIPILNVDGRRHTNNFSKKYLKC